VRSDRNGLPLLRGQLVFFEVLEFEELMSNQHSKQINICIQIKELLQKTLQNAY
jgi:hypothetical protein